MDPILSSCPGEIVAIYPCGKVTISYKSLNYTRPDGALVIAKNPLLKHLEIERLNSIHDNYIKELQRYILSYLSDIELDHILVEFRVNPSKKESVKLPDIIPQPTYKRKKNNGKQYT